MACRDCFVPMCWAGSQANFICSAISLEAKAIAALRWRQEEWVVGNRWVEKLRHVELRADAWHTEPRSPRQTCIDEVDFDADAQSGDNPQ